MASDSPLTSPDSRSDSSPVVKRVGARKRQWVASDDEGEELNAEPLASSSTSDRRRLLHSQAMEEADEDYGAQRDEEDIDIDVEGDGHGHYNVGGSAGNYYQPPTARSTHQERLKKSSHSTKSAKGKGKSSSGSGHHDRGGPPAKKPKKSKKESATFEASDEEFEADFHTDEDEAMDPGTEEDLSEDEKGFTVHKKGKRKEAKPAARGGAKARGGAGGSQGQRGGRAGERVPKFEGARIIVPLRGEMGPTKADSMDMDVTSDVSSQIPPDSALSAPPSSSVLASTSPSSQHGSVGKGEHSAAPVPKKRKLPTIKKNKSVIPPQDSTEPDSSTKSILNEVTPSTATRLPAARVGVADLDLTNKNIYDELFKGGGSALGSDRRAKEAERKRELTAMKKEWMAKRASEHQQTPPFDLQAQNDKIVQFEERLQAARSGAFWPQNLAGKWREIWQRNIRDQRERGNGEQRERTNGSQYVNGTSGGEGR